MPRHIRLLALSLVLPVTLALVACEVPDTNATSADLDSPDTGSPSSPTSPSPTATTQPAAVTGDQAEWDAITWHTDRGPSCKGARQVMTLQSAEIFDGDSKVRFAFDRYPWGGDYGAVHFFVWTGSNWDGGKFDNIRPGGQTVKLTENIHARYNGLYPPASGSLVAFGWSNAAGTERSNLAKTIWP